MDSNLSSKIRGRISLGGSELELDVAERKAVELIRSRLDAGSITVLNAELESEPHDQITVSGLFQDQKGNQRKFEVKFRVKQDKAQIVNWYVTS
jgi:hypothetical protein